MPLPTPQANESQEKFISRCMRDTATQDITGDSEEQTHERRIAACFRQWRDAQPKGYVGAERKQVQVEVEVKDAEKGIFDARFSTLNVKDKDGDWTLPGAFTEGDQVIISHYGHKSWEGELPVGDGQIRATDKAAHVVGQFIMENQSAREHFNVLKRLGKLQQWSYGFDVLETGEVTEELRQKGVRRVLKKVKVYEVSPVMVGAGVGTQTVSVKDAATDKPAETPAPAAAAAAGGAGASSSGTPSSAASADGEVAKTAEPDPAMAAEQQRLMDEAFRLAQGLDKY